jgi:hypothetical protein
MNWKSEKSEKKQNDRHHRGRCRNLMKIRKDNNGMEDKENLVDNAESVKSSDAILTSKCETATRALVNQDDITSTSTKSGSCTQAADDKILYMVHLNIFDQPSQCHGSDLTIDSSLKQCCQLLTGLRLSQTSSGKALDTAVLKSNSERGTERAAPQNDEAIAARGKLNVARKGRSKTNKRVCGKITKKSYRQEGNKNNDIIYLNILLVDNEQSDGTMSSKKDELKRKKGNTKQFVKLAGKRLWKGVRVSCKFLWSGLVLYAKPNSLCEGAMDMNCAKDWDEKTNCETESHFPDYCDDLKSKRKSLNRGS